MLNVRLDAVPDATFAFGILYCCFGRVCDGWAHLCSLNRSFHWKALRGIRWGQEGKRTALLSFAVSVQDLSATICDATAQWLRPASHVLRTILRHISIAAVKICVLVRAVALQRSQVLYQEFV